MSIISEKFLDELIKGDLIKEDAIYSITREGSAKWRQLRAQLKHKFTSANLRFATMTTLIKRDCPQLRVLLETNNIRHIANFLYPGGIENWQRVSGTELNLCNVPEYRIRDTMNNLRDWQQFPRGRNLFIPGYGVFNIAAVIKQWFDDNGRWQVLPSPYDLVSYGYFSGYRYWTLRQIKPNIKRAFKKNDSLLWLLVKNKELIARIDEIKSWQVLNPGVGFPTNLVDRLDDMNLRNLALTDSDKEEFEYPNLSKIKQFIDAGYIFPTNGIDLKRQAQRFKNCAGGYVGRIHNRDCIIAYRKDCMVELTWSMNTIKQAFGPMNTQLPLEVQTELIGLVNK